MSAEPQGQSNAASNPMSLAERLSELRRRQEGEPLDLVSLAGAFGSMFTEHADHPWEQVGRCVFCVPCSTRLYQGTIPAGHPVGQRPSKPPRNLLAEFRARWGDPA